MSKAPQNMAESSKDDQWWIVNVPKLSSTNNEQITIKFPILIGNHF